VQTKEESKKIKANSTDSEHIDIYNQNKNNKLENFCNKHLSVEEANDSFNNNNIKLKVKVNEAEELNEKVFLNYQKRNTQGVDIAEYAKYKNKLGIEVTKTAGDLNKNDNSNNNLKAFSTINNNSETLESRKSFGLKRKHSTENEKMHRRTSFISYKKRLSSLPQLASLNSKEEFTAENEIVNTNLEVITENKTENSINNNNNKGNRQENENSDKNNLNMIQKNKMKECDKILMNIHDYFFPNLYEEKQSGTIKSINQKSNLINSLPELSEMKHYDSDTDIPRMSKFVYEKLENINRDFILNSKFNYAENHNSINTHSNNNKYNSLNELCINTKNCITDEIQEGKLDSEDEQDSNHNLHHDAKANGNNKFFNMHNNREANMNSNCQSSQKKLSNSKYKNSNSKINNEDTASNKSIGNIDAFNNHDDFKNGNLNEDQNQNENKLIIKKSQMIKAQEFSKKSYITSIFYYDWAKDPNKYEVPYYFFTTPMMRLNEHNTPTFNNPLDEMKTITFEELMKIGKFNLMSITQHKQRLIKTSKVFVYDQNTAIPYLITDLRKLNQNNNNNPNNNESNIAKKTKLLVVVINDFYDCYTNHHEFITNALGVFSTSAEKFKILNFNLPAQPFTLFNKKNIFNNVYYSKLLDRLLFGLIEKNVFDHTYSIVFMGFGNGGHIALNYAATNERFFDFINSVIMLNSYCENDENIGKSMLEISKVIENSKNEGMIDFFIKSLTYNPLFVTQFNNVHINNKKNLNATHLPIIEAKDVMKNNNNNQHQNNFYDLSNVNNNSHNCEVSSGHSEDIISKINHCMPMVNHGNLKDFTYTDYNIRNIPNIQNNNDDNNNKINSDNNNNNISNLNDLNKHSFQRILEKNSMGSSEDTDSKLSYQGYSLITKGYFYNIPFKYNEVTTPIIAFHTSNNCFIPLTNLTSLFDNCYNNNVIDFSDLNNFVVKDPKFTMNPISSIDDFSEISPDNKVRRKLVVCEGAHNLIKENQATLITFLRDFFEYSFQNVFGTQSN